MAAVALGVSSTGASADSGSYGYQPQYQRTNVSYNQGYKVSYTEVHHYEYEEKYWGNFSYAEYKKPYQHASYKPEYDKKGGDYDKKDEHKDRDKKDCPHKY